MSCDATMHGAFGPDSAMAPVSEKAGERPEATERGDAL